MDYLLLRNSISFFLYLLLVCWAGLCILSLILTKSLNQKITFDIFFHLESFSFYWQ